MNDTTVFIKQKLSFIHSLSEQSIHLGYSIDNRFARCTGTSIYSFKKNNPDTDFTIHIITSDLSADNINRFKDLATQLSINIFIYIINTDFLSNLNLKTSVKWPLSIYFRFLYPILTESVDKIYYIDGDILCHGDCTELFSIDISKYPLAGCKDRSRFTTATCKALGIPQGSYINSGMMIINIKKWRELNIWQQFLDLIQSKKTGYNSFDQDIINILFTSKILYLDFKYNYQTWLKDLSQDDIDNNKAILLHFGGHPKPWQATWPLNKRYTPTIANIYSNYENNTPWNDVPPDLPKDYKDRRLYAKLLYRNGQTLNSLYQYLIYCRDKLAYKINKH